MGELVRLAKEILHKRKAFDRSLSLHNGTSPQHANREDCITIESVPRNLRPVFWERNDGRIYGPGTVLDVALAAAGGRQRTWVIVEFQGHWEWVVSDRLRSKEGFDTQGPVQIIEPIREVWSTK